MPKLVAPTADICSVSGVVEEDKTCSISTPRQAIETRPAQTRLASPLVVLTSCLTVVFALRYIVWRCAINNWHAWWLSTPLLVAEIFTAMHILGYQYTIWPRKSPELRISDDPTALPITIFIPTVNEGETILEPTVHGALAARERYLQANSHATVEIVVCNDGLVAGARDWQAAVRLAERFDVRCITRREAGGAKAGNIENARQEVGAVGRALIVVLDADQVADPDFLVKSVPPFADPSIGWVQTRQYYRNQQSTVARWAEDQASLFYNFVCQGKQTLNAAFICGSNVVIRAEVLDEIGGFPQESITEDFAASIRTHQSWRSFYLKETLAQGLGPMDLTSYYAQQSRWARGTIGVLLSDWKRLLLPCADGLGVGQRVQYFLSGTHYLCGLRDTIFLTCALLCLWLGQSPIKPVGVAAIAWYLLPYIGASQLLILLQVRSCSIFTSTLIGYSSFPTLTLSFFEALINRRVKFKVTPKLMTGRSDFLAVLPHMLIVGICIATVILALSRHNPWTQTTCIPMFWVTYMTIMLAPTFLLARLRGG